MGYQKDDIQALADELGIDSGNSSSQLDRMKKIAEAVGMDSYSGISNDDTDELQRRLKERKKQQQSEESDDNSKKSNSNKANNARELFNAMKNNQLGDYAKNAVKNKAKEGIKNTANKMVPESVKKKQQQLQAKKKAIQDKVNAPKRVVEEKKAKLNEMAFKKGVKAAVNAAAPGAGEVAEKMLDTSKGKPAVEAARAASNPISALAAGTKKLVEIVISSTVKKKLIIYLIPVLVTFFTILMISISVISKFTDSMSFFKGEAFGSAQGEEAVGEEYKYFYNKINSMVTTDKEMVVAVLVGYKNDNDDYSKDDSESTDTCSDEDQENGDCFEDVDKNGIAKLSKSKVRKYIKKVNNAISDSGNDVTEGNYNDPENTGSKFFQWLYKDFVKDYYKEYIEGLSGDKLADKKEEIISFIYLYYKDLKADSINGGIISNLCPNGITVTGVGTMDLEEYVAGVVAHEAYQDGGLEALKAQAIAARTYALNYTAGCTKPIENSTNAQTFHDIEYVKKQAPLSLKAANETAGMVLTYNGKYFSAQYDSFCYADSDCPDATRNADGTYSVTYKKLPKGETHKVTLSDSSQYSRITTGQGHANGMSQLVSYQMAKQGKKYDEILKFFYSNGVQITQMGLGVAGGIQLGTKGIYSTSILPLNTPLSNLTVTGGYYYFTGYHGSLDIACSGGGREKCTKIPIVAAHSGTITLLQNDRSKYYCSDTRHSNADTTLRRVSGCNGMAVVIKVTDNSDPYKGYTFSYWHFDAIDPKLKVGDKVQIGQFLGYMGSTGNSTGWHLHFNISNAKGQDVNQDINITEFCSRNKMNCSFGTPSNDMPQQ